MTLETRIYVLDVPVPTRGERDVFRQCRAILGATAEHTWTDAPTGELEGERCLANDPMQGLPVWLRVVYRTGGRPVEATSDATAPAHWIRIHLESDDTPELRDLHVRLVDQLAGWFANRRTRWAWRHPVTGATVQAAKSQPAPRWTDHQILTARRAMRQHLARVRTAFGDTAFALMMELGITDDSSARELLETCADELTTDERAAQAADIERMRALLAGTTTTPHTGA